MLDDLDVRAIKTGMLFDADTVEQVARLLRSRFSPSEAPPLVCDPVCVSTSGHSLLHEDAVRVLISELIPLSTLITPNKLEAELLLSHMGDKSAIHDLEGMLSGARNLSSLGSRAVLLKGGHQFVTMTEVIALERKYASMKVIKHDLPRENIEILSVSALDYESLELVADVLYQNTGGLTLFVRPRIESTSTHGTGCTLSAAIASELGKGVSRMLHVASFSLFLV